MAFKQQVLKILNNESCCHNQEVQDTEILSLDTHIKWRVCMSAHNWTSSLKWMSGL